MPRHIACLTFDFDAMSGMIVECGAVSTTMEAAAREYQGRRIRT